MTAGLAMTDYIACNMDYLYEGVVCVTDASEVDYSSPMYSFGEEDEFEEDFYSDETFDDGTYEDEFYMDESYEEDLSEDNPVAQDDSDSLTEGE